MYVYIYLYVLCATQLFFNDRVPVFFIFLLFKKNLYGIKKTLKESPYANVLLGRECTRHVC